MSATIAGQRDPMLLHQEKDLEVHGHLQLGLNAVAERNLFWNIADVPEIDFDSDTEWLETYIKAGLSFTRSFSEDACLYGKLSEVSSYTFGTDAFDASDTGRTTLEEAYLGYRNRDDNNLVLDISAGSREFALGTGMLIANGAANGFERGALKFGPRKAWRMALLAGLSTSKVKSSVFYLAPNELESNKTENRLAGLDIRYDASEKDNIGLSYIHVIESLAPYPKAAPNGDGAPTITPGAREGLHALNVYAQKETLENLSFGLDIAYEWNERIDMRAWAGRFKAEYAFSDTLWKPVLSYYYQTFSGDDPSTSRQERFDPLYYEGSPSAWSTGSKSTMVFINSNVRAHGLTLRLSPSRQDIVTFRYAHIRVNELRSPVQFGQATRVDITDGVSSVISGVTHPHLADDFFVEYSRIINQNTYLTDGYSISIPERGIKRVSENAANWTGGFINVIFNY
ncbi:MAG: hypothetical protein JW749_10465 [Sedimentisphaerales bacterium]|nr:hypothetical protein [Sedimentisphaerales bacterium]